MKVYLAARYSRYPELQAYARDLQAARHISTARWVKGDHEITAAGQAESGGWPARFAREDWEDLMEAGAVVSFTEAPGETPGRARGGRHVEFGAALAMGKRCIIVGFRENVFHYLPEVEFAADWPEALALLAAPRHP